MTMTSVAPGNQTSMKRHSSILFTEGAEKVEHVLVRCCYNLLVFIAPLSILEVIFLILYKVCYTEETTRIIACISQLATILERQRDNPGRYCLNIMTRFIDVLLIAPSWV